MNELLGGRNPDQFAVGGYDGIHLIYEALKKTNGNTDGDALINAMKGMAWESPRGPISIDPETRDIIQTVYLRRVEKCRRRARQRRVRQGRERQGSGEGEDEGRRQADRRRSGEVIGARPGGKVVVIARTISLLFDGFAYGMLLFVLSVGLSVTLGMMNFVNLAHGTFAMIGGYTTVMLMRTAGWPFFATLPVAFWRRLRRASCSNAFSIAGCIGRPTSTSRC